MKKFRSSFNHLVREKLIAGQSDTTPSPETRDLTRLYSDVIVDHAGTFEYKNQDITINTGGKQWSLQGAMGYGNSPVGNGTKPYRSFMSNLIDNLSVTDAYTGSTTQSHITFGPLHHTGAGVTCSVGVAEQYVSANPARHGHAAGTDHRLITVYGVKTSGSHVAGDTGNYTDQQNGIMHLCYRNAADNGKGYSIYVETQDENGTNSEQLLTPNVHFSTPYGRLMPVSFNLEPNGDFKFRVDGVAIESNLDQLNNAASSPASLAMPASGSLHMTVRSMSPTPFTSPWPGLDAPVCRITNVAVNDNDNSDGLDDVGLPPFIVGIPCTPVRDSIDDWELPMSVLDPSNSWIPYAESSPTVEYGLSAVADSQLFETRGVAASGTNNPLYVMTADKSTLEADLTELGLIGLSGVEAVNATVFESAVLGPYNITLQLKQAGTYTDITSSNTIEGVGTDFVTSTTTFFQDVSDQDMSLDSFASGMVFTLNISG